MPNESLNSPNQISPDHNIFHNRDGVAASDIEREKIESEKAEAETVLREAEQSESLMAGERKQLEPSEVVKMGKQAQENTFAREITNPIEQIEHSLG